MAWSATVLRQGESDQALGRRAAALAGDQQLAAAGARAWSLAFHHRHRRPRTVPRGDPLRWRPPPQRSGRPSPPARLPRSEACSTATRQGRRPTRRRRTERTFGAPFPSDRPRPHSILLGATELEVVSAGSGDRTFAVALLAVLAVVPLVWRRTASLGVLLLVLAGVSFMALADPAGEWVTPFAAVLVALYPVAASRTNLGRSSASRPSLGSSLAGPCSTTSRTLGRRPFGDLIHGVLNASARSAA
jgi:hypothetical protein